MAPAQPQTKGLSLPNLPRSSPVCYRRLSIQEFRLTEQENRQIVGFCKFRRQTLLRKS